MKRTPFYHAQVRDGCKMATRGEWEIPGEYVGVEAEHRATRETAGLYDLTTMGEVQVAGKDSHDFLQRHIVNDLDRIKDGQVIYTSIVNERGGIIDDVTLYRITGDKYLVVTGLPGTPKVCKWFNERAGSSCVHVTDLSSQYGLLALQGPKARDILRPITDADLDKIKYYEFAFANVKGIPVLLSRTGFTGEMGYEIYVAPESGGDLWNALMEAGKSHGMLPAARGALGVARTEKRYLLGGAEFDENTTPLEAGIGWTVRFSKPDFVARDVLLRQKEEGLKRIQAGLILSGSKVPAAGAEVLRNGEVIGKVTSACYGYAVQSAIAMAFVPPAMAGPGSQMQIKIGDHLVDATAVKGPFWDPSGSRLRA